MQVRKIPMRTCTVTREKLPKRELLRIVKNNDGEIIVDETGKVNGHGAYIKKDLEVLETAKKTKVLERVLETEISSRVYDDIKNVIENK